jgi:hypothetical protein
LYQNLLPVRKHGMNPLDINTHACTFLQQCTQNTEKRKFTRPENHIDLVQLLAEAAGSSGFSGPAFVLRACHGGCLAGTLLQQFSQNIETEGCIRPEHNIDLAQVLAEAAA